MIIVSGDLEKNKMKNINKDSYNKIDSLRINNINYSKIDQILEMINEEMIKDYLTNLVDIGPRMTGTYGCEKAAEYIYNEFMEIKLSTRYQPYISLGPNWKFRIFRSKNVEATHPGIEMGNNEVIVFNAHYDTVKLSPGANDDGSGVAAVLTAANILSNFQFKRTIKFVTFSGEEINLFGSKAYAKEQYDKKTNIIMDFNADMIGRAVTKEGGRNMGLSFTEDADWLIQIFREFTDYYDYDFVFRTNKIKRFGRGYSDYFPFTNFGYEAIACWGSSDGDPNMHKPTDTIDNVNFSYLTNTTRHIVATIAYLADLEDPSPQIQIVNPARGKFYFEDRIQPIKMKYNKTIVIDEMWVCTEIRTGINSVKKVEFYYDGELVHKSNSLPFQWRLNKTSFGNHKIKVVLFDDRGRESIDELLFFYCNIIDGKPKIFH
jgi:hypothetical protein